LRECDQSRLRRQALLHADEPGVNESEADYLFPESPPHLSVVERKNVQPMADKIGKTK
jgi:hypothetical protein